MKARLGDVGEDRTNVHQAKSTQDRSYYRKGLVSTKASRTRSCDILDAIRLNHTQEGASILSPSPVI